MSLFVEVVSFVNRRNANLKPIESLLTSVGFRSVYMFNQEDAEIIKDRGSSKGFKYFNLHSDCLFVDIDIKNDEEEAQALADIEKLKASNIKFSLWSSGGRSYHLHIPHELKCSRHLPYTHKLIVEKLGIHCDHSLYRANSLFRLPGTIHTRTGKEKVLLGEYGTKELKFSIQIEPVKEIRERSESCNSPLLIFSTLRDLSLEEVIENRYLKFFSLGCLVFENSTLSYDTILDLFYFINNSLPEPNEPSEVERAIKGAYERINNPN